MVSLSLLRWLARTGYNLYMVRLVGFLVLTVSFVFGQSPEQREVFKGLSDAKAIRVLESLEGMPGRWNVAPEEGRMLYDLIVKHKYKRGLEIGTSNGYSSIWLAMALKRNQGQLVTMEIDKKRAGEARQNFAAAGLSKVIDLRVNDAFIEIPKVAGSFDFVFIDADRPDYKKYLDILLPRVPVGGVITAHNVTSHPKAMPDFLHAIKVDKRLESKIHKTDSGISVSFRRR